MLFIATDNDHVTRAKDVKSFFDIVKSRNSKARFEQLRGSSHETPMDKDGDFGLEAIRDFIKEVDES